MLYGNIMLNIQDFILSIIVLTSFGLLIFGLYIFIKKEKKRQKSEKHLLINDVVKYDKLYQLINYRINNQKENLYFSLMLISIDQFNQIKEYVSEDGIKEYIFKIITFIRMNLPKGAKMAQLDRQDTFIVYFPELYEEKDFFKLAETFKLSIEKKVTIQKNINIKKTASLSLAYFPHDGETYEQIFTNLNNALIHVKKYGGNAIALYQDDMKKDNNYYQAYLHLVEAINKENLYIDNHDIYSLNTNKPIGRSLHLYLKEEDKISSFKDLLPTLEQYNDDLWIGLYYFEKSITSNINILQEIGAKPYYIIVENSIKMHEYLDLFGSYVDLINKYKFDASKFVFEIVDEIDIEKNQKAIKNICNLIDLGFKFCLEIKAENDNYQKLLELIDFSVIKMDIKLLNKDIVNNLTGKTIYVYNVNTEEDDALVRDLKIELVEGNFYLHE